MRTLLEIARLAYDLFREFVPISIQPSLIWRRLTGKPLLRNAVLDRWVDHAAWDWHYHPGAGGLTNTFHIQIRRGIIRKYIREYHAQHGRLPTNRHRVNMSYAPDGTADYLVAIRIGTGMLQMRGTVDMEVTFPPGNLPKAPPPEPRESRIETDLLHNAAACPFCRVDRDRVFLESGVVRGMWGDAEEAPRSAYIFTRRPIADWFGATREEQVALTKSIDVVRDALEERLRKADRLLPLSYSVRFQTGLIWGARHLNIEVRPQYVGPRCR
jgi:hypothetical protein